MMRRHHEEADNERESEGARFNFSNGDRRMRVRCPSNESVQACVQAAGQLLDKIGTLRDRNAQGATQGTGLGSDKSDTTPRPGNPLSNQQLNQGGSGKSDSGQ